MSHIVDYVHLLFSLSNAFIRGITPNTFIILLFDLYSNKKVVTLHSFILHKDLSNPKKFLHQIRSIYQFRKHKLGNSSLCRKRIPSLDHAPINCSLARRGVNGYGVFFLMKTVQLRLNMSKEQTTETGLVFIHCDSKRYERPNK